MRLVFCILIVLFVFFFLLEEWLKGADGDFHWKTLDEQAACGMCYTSGTTGNPQGRGLFAPLQRGCMR